MKLLLFMVEAVFHSIRPLSEAPSEHEMQGQPMLLSIHKSLQRWDKGSILHITQLSA